MHFSLDRHPHEPAVQRDFRTFLQCEPNWLLQQWRHIATSNPQNRIYNNIYIKIDRSVGNLEIWWKYGEIPSKPSWKHLSIFLGVTALLTTLLKCKDWCNMTRLLLNAYCRVLIKKKNIGLRQSLWHDSRENWQEPPYFMGKPCFSADFPLKLDSFDMFWLVCVSTVHGRSEPSDFDISHGEGHLVTGLKICRGNVLICVLTCKP